MKPRWFVCVNGNIAKKSRSRSCIRRSMPFALIAKSRELEEQLLLSSEAPIVLLRQNCRASASLARATGAVALQNVSPGNPNLGVMLPYSPLHHLLMRELNFPIVATSGNLSDEPICIDEDEALHRLRGIADVFLVHDRPIVRHVDDSVVRVMCGREMMLRRARGYAPLPVAVGRLCQTPNQGVSQSGAAGTRATQTGSPKGEARGASESNALQFSPLART